MTYLDDAPIDPKDMVEIDGEMVHKNIIREALTIAKLVKALHGQMRHSYISPPCF